MIKIITVVLLFSASLLALDWAKDLESALTTAQKEHKNVMVMVEGSHCGWCKRMKVQTLSDENVKKRLEKFILVKVMREDSMTMTKLPAVHGVPTVFFMKEDKSILEEVVGYFGVQDFISYINDVETKLQIHSSKK